MSLAATQYVHVKCDRLQPLGERVTYDLSPAHGTASGHVTDNDNKHHIVKNRPKMRSSTEASK